ncbi:MAG: TRAP transporter substrate-binding protein [Planctomycetota bacterium]|jgi:tripartite ATP-independent transporter DctP family solute receptor|nr:TRAP transporter substrate-binding protein [Planctomycetota bacterium]
MRKATVLAMCAVLAILSAGIPAGAGETIELKWYQPEPAGHPWTDVGQLICDEIDRVSNGRLKLIQYPAGQLGSQLEALEMLRVGSLAFLTSGPAVLNSFDERVQVFGIPYLVKSREHAYRIIDSKTGQDLFNTHVLQRSGVRTIQFWFFGTRTLSINREVNTPADLANAKVRCMDMPIYKDSVASLGANPTPITFSELYLALQTGVVDGQENPISTIYAQKYFEVQKYIVLTNHIHHMGTVHVSEMIWRRLAEADRKLIMDVFDKFRPVIDERIEKDTMEKLELMKKGGTRIITPDVEAFRKHSLDYMMGIYGEKWGDLIKAIQALE